MNIVGQTRHWKRKLLVSEIMGGGLDKRREWQEKQKNHHRKKVGYHYFRYIKSS